jgi:hypothetical protein
MLPQAADIGDETALRPAETVIALALQNASRSLSFVALAIADATGCH